MESIFILGVAVTLLILNLIREIWVYLDIKSCFYCGYCNTFNEEISRIDKCKKCNRSIKINGNSWDHLILHRVNWIPAKSKSEVFKWKEYRKLSVIEITINTIMICIIMLSIVLSL